MDRAIPFQEYGSDIEFIDFTDEAYLNQFIGLIQGENDASPIVNLSTDHQLFEFDLCLDNGQLFSQAGDDHELFGYEFANNHVGSNVSPNNTSLRRFPNDLPEENGDDAMDGEESSRFGANTNTPTKKKGEYKADRSRTLISERRRRGRMKEKLYTLRALVPNITKMDKSSIVGDAVLYIQDLQMQAKKLKTEIAGLESSLSTAGGEKINQQSTTIRNTKNMNVTSFYPPVNKKIFKMDVFQVGEQGFYVRIVSTKGKGVVVLLYKALESLKSFNVQTSNLAASAENYVLTFTLNIKELKLDISLANLKLWIASAFLGQGFDFQI